MGNKTMEVAIGVTVAAACVWAAAMYILKYNPGEIEKGNYAVVVTEDWNFIEYEFPDKHEIDIFIDRVKKFYDKELEKDKSLSRKVEFAEGVQRITEEGAYFEQGEDLYSMAFEYYYYLKTHELVSKPIERIKLKEAPTIFNMPQDPLLTYIRDGKVIYNRRAYENIKKARKERKEPLGLWKERPKIDAQRDSFR